MLFVTVADLDFEKVELFFENLDRVLQIFSSSILFDLTKRMQTEPLIIILTDVLEYLIFDLQLLLDGIEIKTKFTLVLIELKSYDMILLELNLPRIEPKVRISCLESC